MQKMEVRAPTPWPMSAFDRNGVDQKRRPILVLSDSSDDESVDSSEASPSEYQPSENDVDDDEQEDDEVKEEEEEDEVEDDEDYVPDAKPKTPCSKATKRSKADTKRAPTASSSKSNAHSGAQPPAKRPRTTPTLSSWGPQQNAILVQKLAQICLEHRTEVYAVPELKQWSGNGGSAINDKIKQVLSKGFAPLGLDKLPQVGRGAKRAGGAAAAQGG